MRKILIFILALQSTFAFDISKEVKELNGEFNSFKKYPILIFDKVKIKKDLANLNQTEQLSYIVKYVKETIDRDIDKNEADTILTYHTVMDGSASALPFREGFDGPYKFCAVFPSGSKTDHEGELNRVLGISSMGNPYPVGAVESLKAQLSLKELKLFSLYHELAHCLDKKYVPNQFDTSAHGVHQAESFAEVMALFLLFKKKGIRDLAYRRSMQRTLYTKYMGKFLATDPSVIAYNPLIKSGGAIYFVSPVLLKGQKLLTDYDFVGAKHSLDELVETSIEIVENFALESRDIPAVKSYLTNGREEALSQYMGLAKQSPDFFYQTYFNLKYNSDVIESIDLFL